MGLQKGVLFDQMLNKVHKLEQEECAGDYLAYQQKELCKRVELWDKLLPLCDMLKDLLVHELRDRYRDGRY